MTRSRTVARVPDTFLLGQRDIEDLDIVRLLFPTEATDIGACIGLSRHYAGKDQRDRPKPLHDAILVPSSGNPCDAASRQGLPGCRSIRLRSWPPDERGDGLILAAFDLG
jgi:hypothetical protein